MKKVVLQSKSSSWLKLGLFLSVMVTLFFGLRWCDQHQFQYNLPYGYFHYPKEQTIPFFRKGVPEPGKIGKFGIRESTVKNKPNCHSLFLGDSQTFGSGIFWKDTFSEILNEETNCQWTNVSMPGFTLENEYAIFQEIKNHIPFEHVYLVVYGNDIYESGETPDYIHFVDKQKWYTKVLGFFLPNYTWYVLKKQYFDSVQKRMEVEIQKFANTNYQTSPSTPPSEKEETGEETFVSFQTLYSISPNYFKESLDVNSVSNQNFKRWQRALLRLFSDLNANHKKFTMIYIPLDVEFDPKRFSVYKKIGFSMDPNWLVGDSEFIQELRIFSKSNHVNLIDMRESFRIQKQLLQKEDIHFNEKANRLIADVIKQSM
ncbi:SGNH/GDSL hydrolase family protein [Leptospira levettii]|uniref:SGNH/GDSL hydrolase family protein n=1 Tax=Leptospira levettii TaxID=2023178 RepID=A0ABY2MMR3_9LEPT|nr:SGNH/GDSL hydrolase family protein [Leptospira levettii]MCG6149911.1 SGNH/GDSL hydrolase family protein [Leptospira levettii]MCW7497576.1 SGNH/GDSL hydrolase family protein [Leptospira levettii]MCW7506664.1 SGNH/GDSL hydrolase family protein [Leptospira levettii]MCW7517754.1 SGNH/GDSL hydrolase family protein [Leptospira levettii]TGL69576.1 SGNH/GDSL hydrolase family protein [Leptospira levettii]